MLQVQVTIGRNIGNEPMSDERWECFRRDVSEALWDNTAPDPDDVLAERWEERHTGATSWQDVPEESLRVTLLGVGRIWRPSLIRELARLCAEYGQDAVALSIGDSDLIRAAAPVTV